MMDTTADRARWDERYGDVYDDPADADVDYARYVQERAFFASIGGAA